MAENLEETTITISPSENFDLNYGQTKVLTVTASNGATVTATSSDETVATVAKTDDAFTVTAVNGTTEGLTATITFTTEKTATHKAGRATIFVTVKDTRATLDLSFSPNSVEVEKGKTVEAPTLNGNLGNGRVTYTSSNINVATVDAVTGVVTGVAAGEATITATVAPTSEYFGNTATFTVTVTNPKHTATFSINGTTTTQDFVEGEAITFPENLTDIEGKVFVGWVTTAITGTTDTAPELVTSATMGENDVTYYAVFALASQGGLTSIVDNLTNELTGVTSTNYTEWSGKTSSSDAVYAGQSTKSSDDYIQLRTKDSNSGIVTTASGGKLKKVSITWGTGNTNTRSLQVYGKNSAYSNAADLYKSSTQGTLLGSLAVNGTTELSIDDDYTYVGLRSADGALYISQIDITWESGAGVSYSDYCTTVVAAAVERPVITLADNPFYFSTTATITCATEDASIKYSYDRENWSDYTSALTITETKTIYAKAVKGNDESAVVQVTATKNLAEPTVTIDATGITNTNVFEGTAAGSLSASVKYNETAIDDATVTWSGNNDAVAIINASTGAVTLVGAGSVTFTATYAGNGDYSEKSATYELTVTNTDPNANDGSAEKPYTVAEAIAYINTLGSSTSANDVYVSGIISKVDSYNSTYHSITYWISDDGTTTNQLEVYSGKGLENADFSSKDDLQVGDIVTVKGKVKMYSSTPEFDKNNYLVSLQHKPVITAEDVDIEYNDTGDGIIYNIANYVNGTMTTSTEADWIYGLNSTDDHFDTEHNEGIAYFSATENTSSESRSATITLTFTYGDNKTVTKDVIVTQAGYDPTPSIVFDGIETYSYETSSLAGNTNVHFVAKNINTEELTLVLCDVDGNEANYDWFRGDIYADYYAKLYWDANTDTENARTAYFKVKAGNTESPIFAVTQAKFVADYATLPFEFDGGRNAISTTSGLTQEGLGTDYNSSPYLKFDGTDDYLILKINERPGTLTFDIKGNGFSDGTFTVQTSEDGTAYTDLKTYTELGETQNKSFDNLGENVRYIKWIYTEKVNGNVALGNIVLAKPDNSPRLSVEPAEAEPFTYEENGNLCAEQTFTVTGTNLTGDITVSVTGEFDLRGPTGGYGNSSLTLGSGEEFGVNINDNLQQGSYSGTLTIASEGATSITIPLTGTVTAPAPPTITVAQTTVSVDAAGGEGTIDVTYTKIETNLVDVQFYAADGTEVDATSYDWIAARFDQDKKLSYIVEENTGEARTAYLKVYGVDNNGGDDLIYSELITITQAAASSGDQFALFNGDLVEGDYIIYYGGYAMNTTVSNSRLQYEEVTPENNIITTDNASIVWHIAPSGEYWTIYNSDATAYAAATGTRNQAQMLSDGTDDKALWTVSGNETYEFINKKNAANNVNKNLRNNGTNGFACYSTQTGGALSLYKRASATVTLAASGYASYCCDKALDFSTNSKNDFRAWYVSNVTGTSVTFTEITGKVKAGEGIILYGTPGAKCSLPYTKNGEELTGNMLRGTLEPTEVTTEMVIDGQSYTLFGLSNGKFVKMKNGTVNANKAFLPIPTSQVPTGNNARLDIVFSEETDGISSMQNAGCIMHNEIYDLQGRRVETMKKGSLYIVNGKKVVF
ncbi:MAG: Ig-like domain-containing protein [Prevotella sp.]|nr:Ig-like domain-containing protein [Prevotella sp.]